MSPPFSPGARVAILRRTAADGFTLDAYATVIEHLRRSHYLVRFDASARTFERFVNIRAQGLGKEELAAYLAQLNADYARERIRTRP